jgi:6-phosphofructokinase 1
VLREGGVVRKCLVVARRARHEVRPVMDTTIQSLGPCEYDSPLRHSGGVDVNFKSDDVRVLIDHRMAPGKEMQVAQSFEAAGPRERIFFQPNKTTAGIVTCGGLCPGLNDIIRGIVTQCHYRYGVTRTLGFRYGYEGLVQRHGHLPMELRPESVAQIHNFGGTILGSSRGPQAVGEMVDNLEEMKVDLLFVVGGDGTLKGAGEIVAEIRRRGLKKAVIGIPKTIDNDILFLDKSFGFETAFAVAVQAVKCAFVEAQGAMNGIGLIKLMGRDSGFIACYAALAGGNVDYVLIPEVPFRLDGPSGLLEQLRYRIARRKSAVIVVAEGAGQELIAGRHGADQSGNRKLGDIGAFLKERSTAFSDERKLGVTLRYIDPSYLIRSVPANAADNFYCSQLAQHAVHAAMAGKTGMLVGRWHGAFVHLPVEMATHGRNKVDPNRDLWRAVLESTGQPPRIGV